MNYQNPKKKFKVHSTYMLFLLQACPSLLKVPISAVMLLDTGQLTCVRKASHYEHITKKISKLTL